MPPEQVAEAIRTLLANGRVRERAGRTLMYETVAQVRRLPRDTWMARIGALNSLAESVANTTFGRFFSQEPRAFARTLTFQIPVGGTDELLELYESVILPHLTELSERAVAGEATEELQLSLLWAPYEYVDKIPDPDPDEGEET